MRLFLVRHGESVDNVAGLYAGSRDSPLTSHGVLQARRLAAHLAARSSSTGVVLHVFSSDLQRASNTAQAIVDAQIQARNGLSESDTVLTVVKLAHLRERDFRSSEGLKFGALSVVRPSGTPHSDAETRAEMAIRVDRFIDCHLIPIFAACRPFPELDGSVIIVAHGLILNVLVQSLLSRFAPAELARLIALTPGRATYAPSWTNTGYLEAIVCTEEKALTLVQPATTIGNHEPSTIAKIVDSSDPKVRITVITVNSVEHLRGLKKTRGGIGSARFDSKQKTMDSFFKSSPKKLELDGND